MYQLLFICVNREPDRKCLQWPLISILQTIKDLFPCNATRFYSSNLGQEIGDLNALVIVMTLGGGGGGGATKVICQRVFDGPEAIYHSVFSRGWEICHYGARGDFSPLPSEEEGGGRESSNF